MSFRRYFFLLVIILSAKSLAILFFIFQTEVGLGPDEAQYWTWSQQLDWGYYSKPPGIAWQIALGCFCFGNTEAGVRFGSLLIGFALPLAVFFLAKHCLLKSKTAFWSAIAMAASPIGVLASFLAITDAGIVLFWTLASIVIVSALNRERAPNYLLVGFLVLCGALFKWQIYYFWIFVLVFVWPSKKLIWRDLIGGVAISLLGMVPSLIWNWKHEWATFRHVAGNIKIAQTQSEHVLKGNFWAFLGEQMALLSPFLFIILSFSFIFLIRKNKEIPRSLNFLGMMSFVIIFVHCILAIFKKLQGNWCDFAYPPAIVFLCWYGFEKLTSGQVWIKLGIAFSVILCLLALSIPYVQSHSLLAHFTIPYKFNPFRHNVGWSKLNNGLTDAGYNPNKDFLFSDKYQMSSLLSFYTKDQRRAYFLNLHQIRKNQFSFWPSMEKEQKNKTGYFVVSENSPHMEQQFPFLINEYQRILMNYFEEIHFQGVYPLFYNNEKLVKAALIFKCTNYNGKEPLETTLY
jgi:hypothetical protein